ncbi:hypothetical protein ACHHYP_07462 [Achlya hypogyna]|uniref:Uncharacterized protein n=1 Tax=Achlya hypogyna TaxID=1202772 RepID=A0A1V9ZLY9_ACHHY|nr:hypothetical protein ACHHYP_07462 [Achlya hypogyna]
MTDVADFALDDCKADLTSSVVQADEELEFVEQTTTAENDLNDTQIPQLTSESAIAGALANEEHDVVQVIPALASAKHVIATPTSADTIAADDATAAAPATFDATDVDNDEALDYDEELRAYVDSMDDADLHATDNEDADASHNATSSPELKVVGREEPSVQVIAQTPDEPSTDDCVRNNDGATHEAAFFTDAPIDGTDVPVDGTDANLNETSLQSHEELSFISGGGNDAPLSAVSTPALAAAHFSIDDDEDDVEVGDDRMEHASTMATEDGQSVYQDLVSPMSQATEPLTEHQAYDNVSLSDDDGFVALSEPSESSVSSPAGQSFFTFMNAPSAPADGNDADVDADYEPIESPTTSDTPGYAPIESPSMTQRTTAIDTANEDGDFSIDNAEAEAPEDSPKTSTAVVEDEWAESVNGAKEEAVATAAADQPAGDDSRALDESLPEAKAGADLEETSRPSTDAAANDALDLTIGIGAPTTAIDAGAADFDASAAALDVPETTLESPETETFDDHFDVPLAPQETLMLSVALGADPDAASPFPLEVASTPALEPAHFSMDDDDTPACSDCIEHLSTKADTIDVVEPSATLYTGAEVSSTPAEAFEAPEDAPHASSVDAALMNPAPSGFVLPSASTEAVPTTGTFEADGSSADSPVWGHDGEAAQKLDNPVSATEANPWLEPDDDGGVAATANSWVAAATAERKPASQETIQTEQSNPWLQATPEAAHLNPWLQSTPPEPSVAKALPSANPWLSAPHGGTNALEDDDEFDSPWQSVPKTTAPEWTLAKSPSPPPAAVPDANPWVSATPEPSSRSDPWQPAPADLGNTTPWAERATVVHAVAASATSSWLSAGAAKAHASSARPVAAEDDFGDFVAVESSSEWATPAPPASAGDWGSADGWASTAATGDDDDFGDFGEQADDFSSFEPAATGCFDSFPTTAAPPTDSAAALFAAAFPDVPASAQSPSLPTLTTQDVLGSIDFESTQKTVVCSALLEPVTAAIRSGHIKVDANSTPEATAAFELKQAKFALTQKVQEAVVRHGLFTEHSPAYAEHQAQLASTDVVAITAGLRALQAELFADSATKAMLSIAEQAALSAQASIAEASKDSGKTTRFLGWAKPETDEAKSASLRVLTPTGASISKLQRSSFYHHSATTASASSDGEKADTEWETSSDGGLDEGAAPRTTRTASGSLVPAPSAPTGLMKKFSSKLGLPSLRPAWGKTSSKVSTLTLRRKGDKATRTMELQLDTISGGFDEIKWKCALFLFDADEVASTAPSQITVVSSSGVVLSSKSDRGAVQKLLKDKNSVWTIDIGSSKDSTEE